MVFGYLQLLHHADTLQQGCARAAARRRQCHSPKRRVLAQPALRVPICSGTRSCGEPEIPPTPPHSSGLRHGEERKALAAPAEPSQAPTPWGMQGFHRHPLHLWAGGLQVLGRCLGHIHSPALAVVGAGQGLSLLTSPS